MLTLLNLGIVFKEFQVVFTVLSFMGKKIL